MENLEGKYENVLNANEAQIAFILDQADIKMEIVERIYCSYFNWSEKAFVAICLKEFPERMNFYKSNFLDVSSIRFNTKEIEASFRATETFKYLK